MGILEADTIKQMRWQKKYRNYISGEPESNSRQNYQAQTLSKEYVPGLYLSLDIPDPFWIWPEKKFK